MHLHFKDLDKFGKGEDVPWGTGKGDVKGMMQELKRQGFHGYLSIEYEHGLLCPSCGQTSPSASRTSTPRRPNWPSSFCWAGARKSGSMLRLCARRPLRAVRSVCKGLAPGEIMSHAPSIAKTPPPVRRHRASWSAR